MVNIEIAGNSSDLVPCFGRWRAMAESTGWPKWKKGGEVEVLGLHTCPDILGVALGPPLVGLQPQHLTWHTAILAQYTQHI